jgi:ADP-ribosylglycohydrolase
MTILEDKIKGVLFGQAIGDALGLGTEVMMLEDISKHYPQYVDGLMQKEKQTR